MEMMQISSLVERLTDEQLVQELQQPSGMAPLQVIMGELQRRAGLRGGKPRGFADGGAVRGESERSRQIRERLAGIFPEARFTSGYRTPERNAEVGGVPNSWHTRNGGEAWDFVAPDVTLAAARARIAQAGLPAGEMLRHNAGSGMHLHYSPEGAPLDGAPAPEAPAAPPAPGLTGAEGFPNPANIASAAMNIGGGLAERMGLPAQLGTINDRYADIANMMPDATTPYDGAIQRLQQEEGRERDSNRGRSLMEAGLAMMAAPTPNFMSALAAGGQAGLGARDRIQGEERDLMQSVIQAQLARSQAEQQQARASLEAASGIYARDQQGITAAYGMGSDIARTGAGAQTSAADARVRQDMQGQELASRATEGEKDRNNRLQVIREQVTAAAASDARPEKIYSDLLQDTLGRVGERVMVPGTDGQATLSIYTREQAIADAQEGTRQAIAMRSGGAPAQQQTPPAVNSGQPRRPLNEIFGD